MTAAEVELAGDGPIGRLVLPGGALNRRAALALDAAVGRLLEDRLYRVVVLAAAGPDFCSGPDADLDPLTCGVNPASRLAEVGIPVVAALVGGCRSIGLELALAADIRVAAPGARFAFPEVAAGRLPCWGGTQRLVRTVGLPAATAMLLLGDELDGAAACDRGLVHEVADDPLARAEALAAELAERGPLALELAKEAVRRGAELPLHHALQLEADFNHLLQGSSDRAEGLAAFFDKRPPAFEGR